MLPLFYIQSPLFVSNIQHYHCQIYTVSSNSWRAPPNPRKTPQEQQNSVHRQYSIILSICHIVLLHWVVLSDVSLTCYPLASSVLLEGQHYLCCWLRFQDLHCIDVVLTHVWLLTAQLTCFDHSTHAVGGRVGNFYLLAGTQPPIHCTLLKYPVSIC